VPVRINSTPIGFRADGSAGELALVDAAGTLSWGQVRDVLGRAAGGLQVVADRPGQRWAVLGDNAIPTVVAHAAGILAGVGTAALSRQLTASELAYQFKDAGVVAVVTGVTGLASVLEAAEQVDLKLIVVHGEGGQNVSAGHPAVEVRSWEQWLASAPLMSDPVDRPAAPMLVYTSGTTGRPSGTEVRWLTGTQPTAVHYLEALIEQSHTPPGAHLVAGPLQHNGPLTAVRHLLAGEPVVVLDRFDAERALAAIERHRVSSSVMVPTHFQRMLNLPTEVRERYDVSSLRMLAHTGSACPIAVKEAMIQWFGPVLVESYGGSEVGTLCRIGSNDWLTRRGSVGRAVPPFEVLVLAEDGTALPVGTSGRLCFKAPADQGIRYHHDPDKTASAYVAPGVLTLGDIGKVDDDGFVYITDRAADVVVSGGVNLYPAESEQVLLTHPQVADVAVIGIPHADLGEQLLALVVPTSADLPSAAELEAWCRRTLAPYKCPRRYEFVEVLPRNAMHKLDKKTLRRPYWPSARTVAG
jgi:acyl-CoA synthetase (AMP-forming)/AMP-acid ligase II